LLIDANKNGAATVITVTPRQKGRRSRRSQRWVTTYFWQWFFG